MSDILPGVVVEDGSGIAVSILGPLPKGARIGQMCALRAKDVQHGKVLECASQLARLSDGSKGLAISKSTGFKTGEQVYLRFRSVEIESWFESDTSTPLYKEASE